MRDLLAATLAKQSSDWDHTANLCCLIANVNSTKKKFTPSHFHPYKRGKSTAGSGIPITKNNIQMLRMFCGRGNKPNAKTGRLNDDTREGAISG